MHADHSACLQPVNFAPEMTIFTLELACEVRNRDCDGCSEATETSLTSHPCTYAPGAPRPRPPAYSCISPSGRLSVLCRIVGSGNLGLRQALWAV